MVVVVCMLVAVAADLPFQNPITKSMMQNNDGEAVRNIMETLGAKGEVCFGRGVLCGVMPKWYLWRTNLLRLVFNRWSHK